MLTAATVGRRRIDAAGSTAPASAGRVWRGHLLRIVVPALLTPALFMAMVFLVALPAFERYMTATRQETARSQVESAVSLLGSYQDQVEAGELPLDEAQAGAMERLRAMRYGEGGRDYFWINDLQPVVLMHPYMLEIEGSDIFDIPDSQGRPLLHAFLEIVDSPERGGYCYYQWQDREKRTAPRDKISYVRLFEPWGWIVGTGVYLADVEARIAEMTRTMVTASLLILGAILASSGSLVVNSVRRERLRMAAEQALLDRERTLRAVLDNSVQFIGLISPEGRLLLCNHTSLEFIEATEDDVVGLPFWDTPWWDHSPATQQRLREAIASCREEAEPARFAATHVATDGQIFDVDFSLSPILDAQGRVVRMVAEGRDITVINRAADALREREEDLSTILNSIHDGVFALDADGLVRRVNAVARNLLQVPENEAIGRPFLEVIRLFDADGRPLDDILPRLLAPETSGQPVPAACLDRQGASVTVEVLGAVIAAKDSTASGSVVVLRDRTEEIDLRMQLIQSQKLEAIGRLAGGVAHDFNNLLTGILGNAQLLSDEHADNPSITEPAREIVDASSRAAELSRQLLAFSRKGKFRNEPVDLHEVVREVAQLLERSIDKRIAVCCELKARRPVVHGDPSQLYNALLNLGLNSRDAMPDGGNLTLTTSNLRLAANDPRLAPAGLEPGEFVILMVADTGVGMTEDVRRHIFEPFFTTKPVGKGTGLGLAGVYGCVVNHHGLIEVTSEPGQGTCFTVLLPSSSMVGAVAPATPEAVVPGQGRIMVVDDEESVREIAARALKRFGYEVVVCADGLQAEEYLHRQAESVDLVLLDLVMPGLGGEETFARLRAINPSVPIVIASGYSQGQEVENLLREGAVGFLPKPFSLGELTRVMQRHLPQVK